MPFTVNGIGTSICAARGDVAWSGQADCDSVECLVVLYVPVLPYRTVHSFGWDGTQYRAIPIRWSLGLIARAFLRRWSLVAMVAAGIFGYIAYDLWQEPGGGPGLAPAALAIGLGLLGPVLFWLMRWTDRRNKAIRRVLGPHDLGSSDPATWTKDLLANISGPMEQYGAASFAEASAKALADGRPIQAMWAARLCVAAEDRHEGERLTDEILAHPGIAEAIEAIRKSPFLWPEAFAASSA